jgi:hypothetical protein
MFAPAAGGAVGLSAGRAVGVVAARVAATVGVSARVGVFAVVAVAAGVAVGGIVAVAGIVGVGARVAVGGIVAVGAIVAVAVGEGAIRLPVVSVATGVPQATSVKANPSVANPLPSVGNHCVYLCGVTVVLLRGAAASPLWRRA